MNPKEVSGDMTNSIQPVWGCAGEWVLYKTEKEWIEYEDTATPDMDVPKKKKVGRKKQQEK